MVWLCAETGLDAATLAPAFDPSSATEPLSDLEHIWLPLHRKTHGYLRWEQDTPTETDNT